MNNQATMEKMRGLRLNGMLRAFQATFESSLKNKYTADELVGHLIDAEWSDRQNRKLARLLKSARFRYTAALEEIDFTFNRNLDKNLILRFSDGAWIRDHQNIIITGPTGVGKSFIGSALGNQACMLGYRVLYFNCLKLFAQLKYYQADGSYHKEILKIQKADVCILDDFALEPLDKSGRLSLLEIIEDRQGKKSTVIVSQLPTSKWHDIIGEATIADAICDRLLHTSFKINLKGDSVRKRNKTND